MARFITEIKRHVNKPDQTFRCELLWRTCGHLVVRYVSDREGRIGEVGLPSGSITYAHYWEGRGYVAWRIHDPLQNLIGHLFHICRDVRIAQDRVDYLDMLLDLWVGADGSRATLDQDEVDECLARRMIGEEDRAWIELWRQKIDTDLGEILAEAAQVSGHGLDDSAG